MSDLIERSEVLKQLWLNHKDVVYIDKNECARRIEAIPPAEVIPKGSDEASLAYAEGWKNGEEAERSRRPKGEWIDNGRYLTCSECGIHVKMYWNFCPCCGTVMPTIRNINARPKDEPQTELVNDSPILVKDLVKDEPQTEYERASEQREYDILYEPTYNIDDGSM